MTNNGCVSATSAMIGEKVILLFTYDVYISFFNETMFYRFRKIKSSKADRNTFYKNFVMYSPKEIIGAR